MAIYEVFSHSILLKYKTRVCSKATVFYLIVTLLTFIPPLLVTYRSQGFWKKINFYREQPDVHFKHQMLLVLESPNLDGLIVWSTFPKLNQLLKKITRVPSIQSIEDDTNRDGRKDKLHLTIEVPLVNEEITSVKLLLIFDYKLHLYSLFEMECLAYLHHSSSLPGASFNIIGELSLHQKEPLKHRGQDLRYNKPIIDASKDDVDSYNLEKIFFTYATRNVTTIFQHSYPVWKTGRAANEPFKIAVTVLYPEETIQYRVGFWQLLKWGWIQYFSVLAVFFYVFHCIKIYVFQKQLVPTIVYSPLKQDI